MDYARCTNPDPEKPIAPRMVTITFDAENLGSTLRELVAVVCPDNLAPLGGALIDQGKEAKLNRH